MSEHLSPKADNDLTFQRLEYIIERQVLSCLETHFGSGSSFGRQFSSVEEDFLKFTKNINKNFSMVEQHLRGELEQWKADQLTQLDSKIKQQSGTVDRLERDLKKLARNFQTFSEDLQALRHDLDGATDRIETQGISSNPKDPLKPGSHRGPILEKLQEKHFRLSKEVKELNRKMNILIRPDNETKTGLPLLNSTHVKPMKHSDTMISVGKKPHYMNLMETADQWLRSKVLLNFPLYNWVAVIVIIFAVLGVFSMGKGLYTRFFPGDPNTEEPVQTDVNTPAESADNSSGMTWPLSGSMDEDLIFTSRFAADWTNHFKSVKTPQALLGLLGKSEMVFRNELCILATSLQKIKEIPGPMKNELLLDFSREPVCGKQSCILKKVKWVDQFFAGAPNIKPKARNIFHVWLQHAIGIEVDGQFGPNSGQALIKFIKTNKSLNFSASQDQTRPVEMLVKTLEQARADGSGPMNTAVASAVCKTFNLNEVGYSENIKSLTEFIRKSRPQLEKSYLKIPASVGPYSNFYVAFSNSSQPTPLELWFRRTEGSSNLCPLMVFLAGRLGLASSDGGESEVLEKLNMYVNTTPQQIAEACKL